MFSNHPSPPTHPHFSMMTFPSHLPPPPPPPPSHPLSPSTVWWYPAIFIVSSFLSLSFVSRLLTSASSSFLVCWSSLLCYILQFTPSCFLSHSFPSCDIILTGFYSFFSFLSRDTTPNSIILRNFFTCILPFEEAAVHGSWVLISVVRRPLILLPSFFTANNAHNTRTSIFFSVTLENICTVKPKCLRIYLRIFILYTPSTQLIVSGWPFSWHP